MTVYKRRSLICLLYLVCNRDIFPHMLKSSSCITGIITFSEEAKIEAAGKKGKTNLYLGPKITVSEKEGCLFVWVLAAV